MPLKPKAKTCAACKADRGLQTCSGCRSVKYCSADCQTQHWPHHQSECRRLAIKRKCKSLFYGSASIFVSAAVMALITWLICRRYPDPAICQPTMAAFRADHLQMTANAINRHYLADDLKDPEASDLFKLVYKMVDFLEHRTRHQLTENSLHNMSTSLVTAMMNDLLVKFPDSVASTNHNSQLLLVQTVKIATRPIYLRALVYEIIESMEEKFVTSEQIRMIDSILDEAIRTQRRLIECSNVLQQALVHKLINKINTYIEHHPLMLGLLSHSAIIQLFMQPTFANDLARSVRHLVLPTT